MTSLRKYIESLRKKGVPIDIEEAYNSEQLFAIVRSNLYEYAFVCWETVIDEQGFITYYIYSFQNPEDVSLIQKYRHLVTGYYSDDWDEDELYDMIFRYS